MKCCNRRKPILARDPVVALRYAWLRAPPYHQTNPTHTDSIALTHKAPYEGGQSVSVPTIDISSRDKVVGTALCAFAHPTFFAVRLDLARSFVLMGLALTRKATRGRK